MKKIAIIAFTIISVSILTMSCNKEYNCECPGYSVIVEAGSSSEAQTTCSAKGTDCDVK